MAFADLVARADRAAMAVLGGEIVIYAPAASSLPLPLPFPLGTTSLPVTGIFDTNFVLAKGDSPAGVEAGRPAIFFRLEDLPVDPMTDDPTLTIRGLAYRVIERDSDDMGGIVLFVRRIT